MLPNIIRKTKYTKYTKLIERPERQLQRSKMQILWK